jgi:hypothetical protein
MQSMNLKTEQVLKVDETGRVRTPRELPDAVLDEFERSGMPATQFAARLGVKFPTFASWVQQRQKSHGDGKTLRWFEATAAAPTHLTRKSLNAQLPGGARMEVADEAQAKMAGLLRRELARGGLCGGIGIAKPRRVESYRNFTNLRMSPCETFTIVCDVPANRMKTFILAAIVTSFGTVGAFAERGPLSQPALASGLKLTPARLHPASGLDMASGLGGRGTVRTAADSADAWKVRFPKQPNGRARE